MQVDYTGGIGNAIDVPFLLEAILMVPRNSMNNDGIYAR